MIRSASVYFLQRFFLCLLSASTFVASLQPCLAAQGQEKPVCYFTMSNNFEHNSRSIYILLNPADFTDQRLQDLLRYFISQVDENELLSVYLYSHTDQLKTFVGGRPSPALEHGTRSVAPFPWNKYSEGVLMRIGENEIIRYNLPGGETKTIIVKGKDF